MPNEEIERAKELLSKICINLKLYKKETTKLTEDKIEKEQKYIENLSIFDLINFISNYINNILEIKNEKFESILEENNNEKPLYRQYEELLIKAENDIRKHIKVNNYIL
jgi:hypothetical protein